MQQVHVGASTSGVAGVVDLVDDKGLAATVRRWLAKHPAVQDAPEAAAALAAAEAIDSARSARLSGAAMQGEASMLRALGSLLETLRLMAPDELEESPLDEIRARREKRLAGSQG